MGPRSIAATLALIAAIAAAPRADAQEPPACGRERLGVVACIADRTCECIFARGGTITGAPTGYRWDCSLLQAACGRRFNPPVTVEEFRGQPPRFPAAIAIDRSTDSVTVDTDANAVNSNVNSSTGAGDQAPAAPTTP